MSAARGTTPGRWLGVVLLAALGVAVSVAISLAVQLGPESASPDPPPICGGLYDICCDDQPDQLTNDEGLFDAESEFVSKSDGSDC